MTNHPNRPLGSSIPALAELELLHIIFEMETLEMAESISYPYNLLDPEAESYFETLEQEVLAAGWSMEDLSEQGQILSDRVEQLWSSFPSAVEDASVDELSSTLFQRFAARVPQQLLQTIAQRAQQVVSQNLSLADQLVLCVQECLPNWGEDDLQVFARPLAFQMRSPETEVLESTLQSIRADHWTELSEIEQARLSLVIARYAIIHAPHTDDQ
ncbi:hypothetical protein [Egbenema bharatensis]|uniref:hypothetical protein n=1 Tax=Egbenema bharatensis TaxID=3463334 RepID=UPI003A8B704D